MPLHVALVGLGAVGSALAHHLTQRGARVTGFDRFAPPHNRGSSHGESRITRTATAEGPEYMPIARRAHEIWRDLESRSGRALFLPCGILLLGSPSDPSLTTARTVAHDAELQCDDLDAHGIRSRFPQFTPGADTCALFQRDGGLVRPELAVETQLALARDAGATLHPDSVVERIESGTAGVKLTVGGRVIEADTAVVTAGAWVRDFLPESHRPRVKLQREPLFWLELEAGAPSYDSKDMPVFIWYGEKGLYGFPTLDGGRTVKVAWEHTGTLTDPNLHDVEVGPAEREKFYDTYVAGRLNGVSSRIHDARACIYTVLAQKRFLIDRLPGQERVWLASPCSGHGFKHSTAVGEAIADRVMGREPRFDLAPFAWGRWVASS